MNLHSRVSFAAALFAVSALNLEARIDRMVEKAFAVNGPGLLRVECEGGPIQVAVGNDSTVRVTVKQKINASTDTKADELLKKLELVLEKRGADIHVIAKYERKPVTHGWGSWPPVTVDIFVTVPASFATDLHTSGGSITVADLSGDATLRTSGGAIKVGKMGGRVDARTSGGSISLARAGGAVELKTSGGNISVGEVAGPADVATSGGSIKIERVANLLTARTSGGSIQAHISGPLRDECSLSTSGGSVKVSVDKIAAFRLDASTSGGGVDAEGLTVALEKTSRSRMAGTVNGGGPLLKLRTSGGGILVRAN